MASSTSSNRPGQPAGETSVFRPSVRSYARSTAALGLYAAPVLVALFLLNRNTLALAAVLGTATVLSVGGVLLYIARARVVISDEGIAKRGFTRTRWVSRDTVSRTLLVRRLTDGVGIARAELFVFGADDSVELRLSDSLWALSSLEAIASRIGAEHRVLAHSYTHAQLQSIEPTALTRLESNPTRTTAVVVIVFFLVATPIAFLIATAATP